MSKREILRIELLKLKEQGFRVFINRYPTDERNQYGLVALDNKIIYLQFEGLGDRLCATFSYTADKTHGRGCMYHDPYNGVETLTSDEINKIIDYGMAYVNKYSLTLYSDVNDYLKRLNSPDMYEEL